MTLTTDIRLITWHDGATSMLSLTAPSRPHLLLLVAKDETLAEIEQDLIHVRRALQAFIGDVRLTDSKRWYDARYAACGSWDAWKEQTATGVDYLTRQPYFKGFVVTKLRVGKATGDIVALALHLAKLCASVPLPMRSM